MVQKPNRERRLMMNAIFYILWSGCQWRMLAKDFPDRQAVWSVFRRIRTSQAFLTTYEGHHLESRALMLTAPAGGEEPHQAIPVAKDSGGKV